MFLFNIPYMDPYMDLFNITNTIMSRNIANEISKCFL